MAPNHNAKTMEIELERAGERMLFTTEPSLEMDKLIPNAKANSFPLNQSAKRAEFATVNDSPPKPKIKRPRKMIGHDFADRPIAKMTCPMAISDENSNKHTRTPNRSTRYPPKNGNITYNIL
jgi:hypothetical protein